MINERVFLEGIERLKKGDALEQRGIGRDWVCVIHPALVKAVLDEWRKLPQHDLFSPTREAELEAALGRKVFIVEPAPLDRIEWMPQKTMLLRYHDWFVAVVNTAASAPDDADD